MHAARKLPASLPSSPSTSPADQFAFRTHTIRHTDTHKRSSGPALVSHLHPPSILNLHSPHQTASEIQFSTTPTTRSNSFITAPCRAITTTRPTHRHTVTDTPHTQTVFSRHLRTHSSPPCQQRFSTTRLTHSTFASSRTGAGKVRFPAFQRHLQTSKR